MILAAALVTQLAISAYKYDGPWVAATTVSIDASPPIPLSYLGDLSQVPVPGHRTTYEVEPAAAEKFDEDEVISECRGWCPVPPVGETVNTDYHSIYRLYIGVQLEGDRWEFPGSPDSVVLNKLRYVQRMYQVVLKSLFRDVGIDVRILHVHVITANMSRSDPPVWTRTYADWDNLVPQLPHHVEGVMRLHDFSGGGAAGSVCSGNYGSGYHYDYGVSHIGIAYDMHWNLTEPWWIDPTDYINGWVSGIAMETGHQILLLEHTQCMLDEDGEPVEKCPEPDSGCYNGPRVCPSVETRSYMGYCIAPCTGMPYTQLCPDPPVGAMCRAARHQINALAQSGCFGTKIADINLITASNHNADNDKFYDAADNCPGVENSLQLDDDNDGIGNECDAGCQLTAAPTMTLTGLWVWMIPVGLLTARRLGRS